MMTHFHGLTTTTLGSLGIGTKILDALQSRLDGSRGHDGLILSQEFVRQVSNVCVVKLSVGHIVLIPSSTVVALLGRYGQSCT